MDFNKLFYKLSIQLAGYATQFKEIKQRYTQLNLQIPDLNSSQLPSEFFKRLVDYGQVSQSNLLPLYELYAGSNLPDKEKYTAFEYIRDFNFHQLSLTATEILQSLVRTLIKQPVDSIEITRLAESVPEDVRTHQMYIDHSASLMKLVEVRCLHAFDVRILHWVFFNNYNVTRNIIDPAWKKILDLYKNYTHNQRHIQRERPGHIFMNQQQVPDPAYPSPVEPNEYPIPHQVQSEMPQRHSPVYIPPTPRSNPVRYWQPSDFPSSDGDSILEENCYSIPRPNTLEGVYPGECLIINIEKFEEGSGIKNRLGSDIDVTNIKNTFEQLNFKVTVIKDLSSEQLIRYLKEKSIDRALERVGVFVCFLMSHGEEGRISGSDGKHVEIDTIITNFKNDQCYALQGKPKIFFVQACRGNMIDKPKLQHLHTDDLSVTQPQDADILVCHATTKGKVAVRTDEGSWYISKLCDTVRRGYTKLDLMKMHTKVNHDVSEESKKGGSTLQVSNFSGSLTKTLYFHPNTEWKSFLEEVKMRK